MNLQCEKSLNKLAVINRGARAALSKSAAAARSELERLRGCGGVEILMIAMAMMMIWQYGKQLENCCRRRRFESDPGGNICRKRPTVCTLLHLMMPDFLSKTTLSTLSIPFLSSDHKKSQTLTDCVCVSVCLVMSPACHPSRQNELLLCKVGM